MEDRITPFLYLEMTNQSADDYARERIPEVLARHGVDRGSWWDNCVLHRTDLPRTLAEFTTLGVYECDEHFHAPETPDDILGLHFRHYPRPGQGTVSAKPTLGIELVLISPKTPDEAQALRDWGDFVHIHDIAAAQPEHFTMITPYENVTGEAPLYMHFYELDTDDPEPAFRGMTPATEKRIGEWNTHPYEEWFMHPSLVIDYVNTFRRLGTTIK
jgi:hypothetical protein